MFSFGRDSGVTNVIGQLKLDYMSHTEAKNYCDVSLCQTYSALLLELDFFLGLFWWFSHQKKLSVAKEIQIFRFFLFGQFLAKVKIQVRLFAEPSYLMTYSEYPWLLIT